MWRRPSWLILCVSIVVVATPIVPQGPQGNDSILTALTTHQQDLETDGLKFLFDEASKNDFFLLIGWALLPSKIASFLLSGIGTLGLLLATIGICGVVAYSVGRRTAEIGIRMALGATKAHVLGLILKDAGQIACVGTVTGAALASFIVQPLGKALPAGMPVVDLLSFVTVGCALTFVGLCAALIPAWRASRIDPMQALRTE